MIATSTLFWGRIRILTHFSAKEGEKEKGSRHGHFVNTKLLLALVVQQAKNTVRYYYV